MMEAFEISIKSVATACPIQGLHGQQQQFIWDAIKMNEVFFSWEKVRIEVNLREK